MTNDFFPKFLQSKFVCLQKNSRSNANMVMNFFRDCPKFGNDQVNILKTFSYCCAQNVCKACHCLFPPSADIIYHSLLFIIHYIHHMVNQKYETRTLRGITDRVDRAYFRI